MWDTINIVVAFSEAVVVDLAAEGALDVNGRGIPP